MAAALGLGGLFAAAAGAPVALVLLLRRMEASVGLAPPTSDMLASEPHANHVLFRHLPILRGKLAWRQLGQFPTPIHRATAKTHDGLDISFEIKREDLSSAVYGGQKVRTLQHTLAVVESRLAAARPGSAEQRALANIGVLGSGGSNQIVATAAHAAPWLPKIRAIWAATDEPDLDNTLNMLSTLSFSNVASYSTGLQAVRELIATAVSGVVITLGGNCPAGVLGHVSAALEYAEQMEKGETARVDALYLAVGSSCTISGLIIGVALSRQLGLDAFASPRFRIHGIITHHVLASAERQLGIHRRLSFMPGTIGHTVREGCAALRALGGPDVTADALATLRDGVRLHTDPSIVGSYGAHSEASREAARAYDATGEVVDGSTGAAAPPLWLCGHFVAKAYAVMAADLAADPSLRAVLWQTKSRVQPRGLEDEWARLQAMGPTTHEWANRGVAESELRPGAVNVQHGTPDDYRGLMTEVDLGEGQGVAVRRHDANGDE